MAQYDVSALSTALEYESTDNNGSGMGRVPGADKVVIAWCRSNSVWLVQCFNVNKSTGAITAIGSPLDFEPSSSTGATAPSVCIIDASNFTITWNGSGDDGYIQLFSLDGTGNVSANGSSLEYDTTNGTHPTTCLMDSTHILVCYQGASGDGFGVIIGVNTGTGVCTKIGTAFEFDTSDYSYGSVLKISSTKAILFYRGVSLDGYAVVLSINTGTWAVTAAGSTFTYKANTSIFGNSVIGIDLVSSTNVVIDGYSQTDATQGRSDFRSFNINTTTWAITAKGAEFEPADDTGVNQQYAAIPLSVDSTHIIVFYCKMNAGNRAGYARVATYNSTSGDLSNTANDLNFTTSFSFSSAVAFPETPGFFVCEWSESAKGKVRAFQVALSNLKNINGLATASVKNVNGLAIGSMKNFNGLA